MLNLVQWPAMVVTILSTWLVASKTDRRRAVGFYTFLLSNVLWVIWGWSRGAYAVVIMQIVLAILNIRGVAKNHEHANRNEDYGT
jgi:hypothetical protein